MDKRIHPITEKLQNELGLEHYVLKSNHIHSETTIDNKTNYILSLEWLPSEKELEETEDFNPSGSAVVEIDFHSNAIKRIIFVNDVSYATEGTFPSSNVEDVIEWVESKTGLMFGRQFKLVHEDGYEFSFQATIDNIEVAPTGNIDVTFNESGQLTLFSIDGVFPNENEVNWEPFSLTKEAVRDEIKQRIQSIEVPIEEEEKWLNVWHMNQFYICNDTLETILPESIYQLKTFKELDVIMKWNNPSTKPFVSDEIDFSTEISYEEALAKVPVKKPINDQELQIALKETEDFLSRVYPNDSGKWRVTGMYPEKDYIITELTSTQYSLKAFQRKIKVIINRETSQTVNYWDSKFILDRFRTFKASRNSSITLETAFEKLISSIQVTPIYVKVSGSERYQLCGKIDCDVVVDATTGELRNLNEL